ncbi:MAG TPA: hypothetical protein DGH68_12590 [Bacteroidetes bacterium]|nr:hypothetical protein [Bacteroidota bacterium]
MFYDTSGTVPVLFRARVRDARGKYSAWSNIYHIRFVTPTAVNDGTSAVGDQYKLEDNYPNPFNPSTTIRFSVPAGTYGPTSLRVYDLLGKEVRTLVNEELKAGSYEKTFDATGLSSGVYFYRLQAGESVSTKKLLLMK